MAVQVSYPGVYISEFAPGAPIEGVGTATAAFVGIAANGILDQPIKITSWDAFQETFGYFPVPGFFLWYAVRGFFDNGGTVCYIVRASNGAYDEAMLPDRVGNDVIRARARQPGAHGFKVSIVPKNVLSSADTELYQPSGPIASIVERSITMGADNSVVAEDVAARFRPGDYVTVDETGERVQVVRVSGATILIDTALADTGGAEVRLADIPAGFQTVRLRYVPGNVWSAIPAGTLIPGTVLTLDPGGPAEETHIVDATQAEYGPEGISYRVTFRDGFYAPMSLADNANPVSLQSEEFDFVVASGASSQTYANLSVDSAHDQHFIKMINEDAAGLISVESVEPPPAVPLPDSLPGELAPTDMTGGADETLSSITDADFIDALRTLEDIDDVNLIAVPDATTAAVQQAAIQQCEQLADRFAVLDARPALELYSRAMDDSIEDQRKTLDSARGYGALYYPWLRVSPVGSGDPTLVPPSGHVCGIIARSDAKRGVHKAPANETVSGALGIERLMSNEDHGQLNLQGINVIRTFAGGRPTLWGARTTAIDTNWRYVNIRRLFLFIEESIQEGTQWAVFEPNNLQLWQKLKRTINEFLNRVWRDGALFGATPEEAYYTRIDEVLNPFSEQALGRLHIEIGLRPSYPAEFIVVRIGIWPGGATVSES